MEKYLEKKYLKKKYLEKKYLEKHVWKKVEIYHEKCADVISLLCNEKIFLKNVWKKYSEESGKFIMR